MAKLAALAHLLAGGFPYRDPSLSTALSSGLAALPQGAVTELIGDQSAGRAATMNYLLAEATLAGEIVAVVDSTDSFDAMSAHRSCADLRRLLWIQCGHRVDFAMKAADMIVHSGGFGLIVLDLCDARARDLNRIPISYWHRFRRAVQNTPSRLLVIAEQPLARSCASRQFLIERPVLGWIGAAPFQIVAEARIEAISRKPVSIERTTLVLDNHAVLGA